MSDKINNYGIKDPNSLPQGSVSVDAVAQSSLDSEGDVAIKSLKASVAFGDLLKDANQPTALEPPTAKATPSELKKLGDLSLEQLLTFIKDENRTSSLKTAENMIKSNKADRDAAFQEKMNKIEENIKKAEEAKQANKIGGIFGWIATIVSAVVSAVAFVGAVCSGNIGLAIVAGIGLYASISGIVGQATGEGLTERCLKGIGFSDDVSKYLGMGLDIVGALCGGIFGGGGIAGAIDKIAKVSAKLAVYAAKVMLAARVISGAAQITKGGLNIDEAFAKYDLTQGQAEVKELEAKIQKLLADNDTNEKMMKAIMEHLKNMTESVDTIVKDKNQTAMNVASLQPSGAGGMA